MDPSLPALPVLVGLLLGITLPAQAFDELDYCRPPKICPLFTRVSTNQKYEVRIYAPSVWMCTEGDGIDSFAVARASIRLMTFRSTQSWALVVDINPNTWPSLVSLNHTDRGKVYNLCWMIPPGVTLPSSGQVTVKTIPWMTVFVRKFDGIPTYASGESNSQKLMEDLEADGQCFDKTVRYGAAYERFIARTHHNEIWIPKE